MTIKNLKKNVSAEKDYIITDVQDNVNGMLTFTLRRLYYDSDAVDSQGQSLSQRTIQIDLSKHKLKLFKFNSREEGLEVLEALKEGEDIPTPYTELDKESHIFLLPKNTNDEGSYQEFMWVDNDFEIIGSTDIDLEPYFLKANVHNALDYSTNDAVKALSAYQGYVLNTTKFDKSDVANNLTTSTNNASKALSAYQGYVLNENKINKNDIVDNLTTNDNTKVLSAKQGKALEDSKLDKVDVINSLDSTDSDKALSASMGKELFMTIFSEIDYDKVDEVSDLPSILTLRDATEHKKFCFVRENKKFYYLLRHPGQSGMVGGDTFEWIPIWFPMDVETDSTVSSSDKPVQSGAVNTELAKKVDKVTGKGLSTNDFTTAEKNKLDSLQNTTIVDNLTSTSTISALSANQGKVLDEKISNKVDKVTGKDLSTNDFTNAYKQQLDNLIANPPTITVVDNLTSTSTTDALSASQGRYLKNEITDLETATGLLYDMIQDKVDKVTGKDLSSNDFTNAYKQQLDNLIANPPTITVVDNLTSTSTTEALSAKQGKVLDEKISDKVDKVTGKGLSTNDFTTAEKNKLDGLQNTTIVDNLTSTSTTSALSANQGYVLKSAVDTKLDTATYSNGQLTIQ